MAAGGDLWAVGKYCALRTCKALDFLPIQCASCSEHFCKDHGSPSAHQCGALRLLRTHACPNCLFSVDVMRDSEALKVLAEHQCVKKSSSNRCTFVGKLGRRCPKTELIASLCPSCHKNFCFSHVQPESHECAVLAAEKAQRAEAKAASGKLVTKKGRENLPLAGLWVTQDSVLDAEQLFPLALFVHDGGVFSSAWSRQTEGREAMAQTFDSEVLVANQFPIHIWEVSGTQFIFRGHSFALSVWYGGRDFLYPEEYVLRKATIDLNSVNPAHGFLLPFDPFTELRTNTYPTCKREASQLAASTASDSLVAVLTCNAIDNSSRYKSPRGDLKGIAELFASILQQLDVEVVRMQANPDILGGSL